MTLRQKRKERTREKILNAAARQLKERGLQETSIQKVMAEAKLTHGSFYAYFKDKDELIIQAFRWSVDQALEKVKTQLSAEPLADLPAEKRLQAFLKFYLSPLHRSQTGSGCPISALARDFSTASPKFRREFSCAVDAMIEDRRKLFSDGDRELTRAQWIGIMSCYVGALILSRACEGEPISDEVLHHSLQFALERKSPDPLLGREH